MIFFFTQYVLLNLIYLHGDFEKIDFLGSDPLKGAVLDSTCISLNFNLNEEDFTHLANWWELSALLLFRLVRFL